MSTLLESEARAIIAALRTGAVPQRGLHHYATGLDGLMDAIEQELDYVAQGHGQAKWIRGEYGSGKTFATRLLCARARRKGFATAEVQISINDTPLHHLETVYRRLIERLTTDADGTGAFRAVVEGWLYEIGEQVTRLQGLSEDDPEFAGAVEVKLEQALAELSAQNPAFAQVLRAYFRAIDEGDLAVAQGLLAWLGGQPHVDRSIMQRAGIKGAVDGAAALAFLRGLLLLLRQSGHAGLVVVLDEVETIQRMPAQTREKSLNALRQLVDMLASEELVGFYLVVTGTPDFFDGYKGLKGLQPLYQRVATRFGKDPRYDNLRAPQVRLMPFDRDRLEAVGRRIRDIYPAGPTGSAGSAGAPERLRERVSDAFIAGLVEEVTRGFGGHVSLAPRMFLRELVDVLDRVDQHAEYDPRMDYELCIDEAELGPEELAARRAMLPPEDHDDGELDEPDRPTLERRRLDG